MIVNRTKILIITVVFLLAFVPRVFAQDRWRVALQGGASLPVAGLAEWFSNGSEVQFRIGKRLDNDWLMQGIVEYAHFSDELFYPRNLGNEPYTGVDERIDLMLEHVALWLGGRYDLYQIRPFSVYLQIAGGPLYWKGIRGEVDEIEELTLPSIPGKTLEEWNMGCSAGLGAEMQLGALGLDVGAYYRFVVGSLWPTMQEFVELDAVDGFQSIAFRLGIYYQF